MGLNLPIKRVLFSSLEKFDGKVRRTLTPSEIRQIAGRAGRYGLSEGGYAGVLVGGGHPKLVAEALDGAVQPAADGRLPILPPWRSVEIIAKQLETDSLREILDYSAAHLIEVNPRLRPAAMDRHRAVASFLDSKDLSLRIRFQYLAVPIDSNGPRMLRELATWARLHSMDRRISAPKSRVWNTPSNDDELGVCEYEVRRLSAYLWLAQRFPETYTDVEAVVGERYRFNNLIERALSKRAARKAGVEQASELDPRWAKLKSMVGKT